MINPSHNSHQTLQPNHMFNPYCKYCDKPLPNRTLLNKHQDICLDQSRLKLVNLGKEQIQDFSKDDLFHLFGMDNIIARLFKHINLDPDKPQYHNILYTNSKSENALVFKTNKWVKVNVTKGCSSAKAFVQPCRRHACA